MIQDLPILALVFLYVFAVLGAAERLRQWRDYPVEFTRKVVHIAAGMTVWLILFFRHLPMALIPSVAFIFLNILSYRQGLFQAMETGERGNLGTIYFPISFAVLTFLLWENRPLLVAAMMPMTWGDALAAVVGRRWGRRTFSVLGSTRSIEGSLTFLVAAWVATSVPLLLLQGDGLSGGTALLVGLGVAGATTVVEALTPWGLDNLTVPVVSALVLTLAQGL